MKSKANIMVLSSINFSDDVYTTQYGKVLSSFSNPVCPSTYKGLTQVYNPDSGLCVSVPPASIAASSSGVTSAVCGDEPFKVEVNGACYSTNTCATSSPITKTCLNTQHVPVREMPLSGAGVLHNSVYGATK